MCKSWSDTLKCLYGRKCRFAHGKNELFDKNVNAFKYKQKDCNSFNEKGSCMYGARCNFRHDERKISQIERSYHNYLLFTYDLEEDINCISSMSSHRLKVFEKIAADVSLNNSSVSISTCNTSPINLNKSITNSTYFFTGNLCFPMIFSNFPTSCNQPEIFKNLCLKRPMMA